MNLQLSEEQQILKAGDARVRRRRDCAGSGRARRARARFPSELIPKLAEQGLLGIMVPEEYGGAGYDALSSAIILEEIARVDAAVALLVGSHNSLCSGHILLAGTRGAEAQLSAAPGARRKARGVGAHRARIGLGRRGDADARHARRRPLGHSRRQAIHHAGLDGRHLRDHGIHRSARRARSGISAFIVDRETPGLVGRQAGEEARRARVGYGGAALRRHAGAEGRSARQGERRLQGRALGARGRRASAWPRWPSASRRARSTRR